MKITREEVEYLVGLFIMLHAEELVEEVTKISNYEKIHQN